jgi:flagellar biosynthesis protein FliQ
LPTEQERFIATVTLIIVIALMIVVIVFIIGVVIAILRLQRKNGKVEDETLYLKPRVAKTAIESTLDEDDGIYECVSSYHRDLE